MPTGLTNSPKTLGGLPNIGPMPPRSAINRTFNVIITTTGVPQPCPAVAVEPGANVSVRGSNGTNAGNAALVRTALYRGALSGQGGDPITPDTEINYPIDNTGQIWVVGTAGDGIAIAIRANRQG
jgi:hypothetical protein